MQNNLENWEMLSANDFPDNGERLRRVWVASVEEVAADRNTKKRGDPRLKPVSSFGSC
jgi:hypothetical protein